MTLRIVLMGTGEFALPPFRALMEDSDRCQVVGVYTQPDRTGRGHHRHVNKVKQLAEEHGIPVFQPVNVNTPESLDELHSLRADAFIVAAYGQILKSEFLAVPPLGAFNLHGSLLPRHRGAAPVQYAIWKGDATTGVTIFQIERALDSGPMVGSLATDIEPGETSGGLMHRLAQLSVPLTLDVVQKLGSGNAVFQTQDESQVTLAPKIQKTDGVIDWRQSAAEIGCHVRAMQPWPKASTWLHTAGRKSTRCIILDTRPTDSLPGGSAAAGSVCCVSNGLFVQTGDGVLEILKIQPEGKKPMDGTQLVNGYGLTNDSHFHSAA